MPVLSAEPSPADSRTLSPQRRDRIAILVALLGVTAIAWLYLLAMPAGMAPMAMGDMPGMAMPMAASWTFTTFALTFVMWSVMMLGMMLPSVFPMILVFATLNRSRQARGQVFVRTSIFTAGYLVVWGVFSLGATVAQWALDRLALLSPALATTSTLLGGGVLVLAGLYQLTPLKQACLRQCRSPFAFLVNHWRDGRAGALRMGLEHGGYCLGCCWVLMALLFVVGVMNLLWVAGIAAFVFAEKLLPGGMWLARAGGGAVMLAFGAWLLAVG